MLTDVKVCTKCGEGKSPEEFSRDKSTKDGRQYKCKSCNRAYKEANKERRAEYQKAYAQANKDKKAERNKAYAQANKEKIAEYRKAYYQANTDKHAEQSKAYREDNKERIAERRKSYYEANKEKINEQKKAYYSKRRAKFAVPQRWVRSACPDDLCYWCGTDLTKLDSFDVTLEHLMPLELGGEALPHNEAMACRPCNNKKFTKHPLVWLAHQF
jgi:hypothetical protein